MSFNFNFKHIYVEFITVFKIEIKVMHLNMSVDLVPTCEVIINQMKIAKLEEAFLMDLI
jgi:hypothetical protein